jgi:spore maturation protein CgeB
MNEQRLRFVFCGLSITSSWGNGHATTYRALLRALSAQGHEVSFLEFDKPWYAANRDMPDPPYARTHLFGSVPEFKERFTTSIQEADVVVVGSYVPEGVDIVDWVLSNARGVTAFYDIDTPVTLSALLEGKCSYLAPWQIPRFSLYLSFTGGPTLKTLEKRHGARRARALYCSVDVDEYHPAGRLQPGKWDLAYLGTYSLDRQPALERLLLNPARQWTDGRFAVAGPLYPDSIAWPPNVDRFEHLSPREHRSFYHSQRFTLNITRQDMVRAGYSPSVRLFEAAACGTPIISDLWPGLDHFFEPGEELLVAQSSAEALQIIRTMPEEERQGISQRAQKRVLVAHTSHVRATELCSYTRELMVHPA